MSDSICPDCHLLALDDVENGMMRCSICGWQGNAPYRKMMDEEMVHKKWMETNIKRELREKGSLFCYKIYLEGKDEETSNAKFEIMEVLQLNQLVGNELLLFFREIKIFDELLNRIKKIKHVQNITVF